jgi:hypothetical protein
MRIKVIFSFAVITLSILCTAAGQGSYDSLITGVWKGTSLCQIKNSSCHDEQVVYHISKGDHANEFKVLANKVIQGTEEDMGILIFTFNANQKELTCSPRPNTTWKFKLSSQKMEGTLYSNKELYRIISLAKSS